jgi:hypothetical protein
LSKFREQAEKADQAVQKLKASSESYGLSQSKAGWVTGGGAGSYSIAGVALPSLAGKMDDATRRQLMDRSLSESMQRMKIQASWQQGGSAGAGIMNSLAGGPPWMASRGAAAAGGAGLAYAVKAAADLESWLAKVRQTTGLVGSEMRDLRSGLLDLGSTVAGVSNKDLMAIAANAGQLGIEGKANILKFTESVAKMAAVSGMSAEETADRSARKT